MCRSNGWNENALSNCNQKEMQFFPRVISHTVALMKRSKLWVKKIQQSIRRLFNSISFGCCWIFKIFDTRTSHTCEFIKVACMKDVVLILINCNLQNSSVSDVLLVVQFSVYYTHLNKLVDDDNQEKALSDKNSVKVFSASKNVIWKHDGSCKKMRGEMSLRIATKKSHTENMTRKQKCKYD